VSGPRSGRRAGVLGAHERVGVLALLVSVPLAAFAAPAPTSTVAGIGPGTGAAAPPPLDLSLHASVHTASRAVGTSTAAAALVRTASGAGGESPWTAHAAAAGATAAVGLVSTATGAAMAASSSDARGADEPGTPPRQALPTWLVPPPTLEEAWPTLPAWPTLGRAGPSEQGASEPWALVARVVPVLSADEAPSPALLLALVVAVLLASELVRRARARLPSTGLVPRALAWLHIGGRSVLVLLVLSTVPRLLPSALSPLLPWMLVAAAAAVGWSVRDVLADVVAGLVLGLERRLTPGTWVSCGPHEGVIERHSLRAVWLVDAQGQRVAVPHRVLLASPVVTHAGRRAEHELALRVPRAAGAAQIRRALVDAVLTSPWVRPEVRPLVRRDGLETDVWHVRAELLDARFAPAYEGELLERVEELLAVSIDPDT
jgi:hypothetical protein